MATQLLATGSTAADSTDLVVSSTATVMLKGLISADVTVAISLKDDGGNYLPVGTIIGIQPVTVINGPGTYRFSRKAGETCGVFSA